MDKTLIEWLVLASAVLIGVLMIAGVTLLITRGRPNSRPASQDDGGEGYRVHHIGTHQTHGPSPDAAAKRKKLGQPEPTQPKDDDEEEDEPA